LLPRQLWMLHKNRTVSCLHSAEDPMASVSFTVNGQSVGVAADGDTPLLDVLRNHLGLTGTRFGCGLEQCGACMVLIDGVAGKSCGVALSTVAGKRVLTIEGHCHVNIGRAAWNQGDDVAPIMRRAGRSSPAAKY
jgi:hypothetical protein